MELILEREQDQISVPTPDGGAVLVDLRQHRPQVVRRLLTCGVSADTLVQLLPEWSALIVSIAHQLDVENLSHWQASELP